MTTGQTTTKHRTSSRGEIHAACEVEIPISYKTMMPAGQRLGSWHQQERNASKLSNVTPPSCGCKLGGKCLRSPT